MNGFSSWSSISQLNSFITRLLKEILVTHESTKVQQAVATILSLSSTEEDLSVTPDMSGLHLETLAQGERHVLAASLNLLFALYNLVEEHYRASVLRQRDRDHAPEEINESIEHAVAFLQKEGVTAAQMQAIVEQLDIEFVLTAHPTETKRRTNLKKYQRVSDLLEEWSRVDALDYEQDKAKQAMLEELTSIWFTRHSRTVRPSVGDEVHTGLHFVQHTFWDVLPEVYDTFEQSLQKWYPGVTIPNKWLHVGSWMGGDRDGNPGVTAQLTADTLQTHRNLATSLLQKSCLSLAQHLSLSASRTPFPDVLEQWLDKHKKNYTEVMTLVARYPDEKLRQFLTLLACQLEHSKVSQELHVDQLTEFLQEIQRSLPLHLREGAIKDVQRRLSIFGLHAMRLDLREDSAVFNKAVGEVVGALQKCTHFETLSDTERTDLLLQWLSEPTPSLASIPGVTQAAEQTWALFRLLEQTQSTYGTDLLGPVIISMTRGVADLLAVLLLARWTNTEEGLSIVPLFETIDDLKAAPAVLTQLFTCDVYREHLQSLDQKQMVMIGYSDSNKDGGYLTASWSLYQAQQEIVSVCQQHNVKVTLFHGRGGTAARGGGATNRTIHAQPVGTVNSRFRITEQGEVLSARYADPVLARRHLEQVVHAVMLCSSPNARDTMPNQAREVLEQLSQVARKEYRSLVFDTPAFLSFWREVTPIDELNRLLLGSRPAARRSGPVHPSHLRAIPWVFSWMQSRFNIPGWYGVGQALHEQMEQLPLFQQMYREWPFFKHLIQEVERSLVHADMDVAKWYVSLASEKEQAQQMFSVISGAYDLTENIVLQIKQKSKLFEDSPLFQRLFEQRNVFLHPLHKIQIQTLQTIRSTDPSQESQLAKLRETMALTVNGIAAGLRSAG